MALKLLPSAFSYPKDFNEPKFETYDFNETFELNMPMKDEYQDDHRCVKGSS